MTNFDDVIVHLKPTTFRPKENRNICVALGIATQMLILKS
ncbi:hypothetical protein SAMN05421768_101387 [Chryseobacterium joostei]|uniref:Uncharacterized protein n=1 Tax=Chryseobacterium joostei TaxID=112234 RepID=A0A1N7HVL9_9FLAO|nr:hypothetical protein SAMN05421768_101387 [Chryseobacterium joostei]